MILNPIFVKWTRASAERNRIHIVLVFSMVNILLSHTFVLNISQANREIALVQRSMVKHERKLPWGRCVGRP